MNLGRQGRLPGRSGMLGAARRTSRGKGRDHGANVETCLGTNMVVVTMAIPSKIQKPPRITSPEKVMRECKIWRDKVDVVISVLEGDHLLVGKMDR